MWLLSGVAKSTEHPSMCQLEAHGTEWLLGTRLMTHMKALRVARIVSSMTTRAMSSDPMSFQVEATRTLEAPPFHSTTAAK